MLLVLTLSTLLLLTTNECPTAVAVPRETTVWARAAFAGQSLTLIADSGDALSVANAQRQRATASGFVVIEMHAFTAKVSATEVSFGCDAKSDDDVFAPFKLRKLTRAQLTRDAGREVASRFETADALLIAGRVEEANGRFEALAEDLGSRPTGVLSALSALETHRRLGLAATVAKHNLAFWVGRASRTEDAFADETTYRAARAALAWREYESAFAMLSHHDRAHLSELRRQALLIVALREAMTDAYLAQNDERVATLYAKFGEQLLGDDNAWSLVTMASESLLELDLPNEALATFNHFAGRHAVVCSSLLHLDAAVSAQQPEQARELIATLRPQAHGQQKRRLEQLAHALPSASTTRTGSHQ